MVVSTAQEFAWILLAPPIYNVVNCFRVDSLLGIDKHNTKRRKRE